jgi:hypothetical protein
VPKEKAGKGLPSEPTAMQLVADGQLTPFNEPPGQLSGWTVVSADHVQAPAEREAIE